MVPTVLPLGQQGRHRRKDQTFGLHGGGEGGMTGENSTETCKLPCVKQIASAN